MITTSANRKNCRVITNILERQADGTLLVTFTWKTEPLERMEEFRSKQFFGRVATRMPGLDYDGFEVYALSACPGYTSTHIAFKDEPINI